MDNAGNEGIVTIDMSKDTPKDPFHINNSDPDILILEICKLQATKDEVVNCLTSQQNNIFNHKAEVQMSNNFVPFSSFALTSLAVIIVLIGVVKLFSGRR